MKFLYATSNKGKQANMIRRLQGSGFELVFPQDLNCFPKIVENGKNEVENAIIKAKAYVSYTDLPILAADSGLYFENVKSPGLFVKRVEGKELSDDELIEYHKQLAKQNGGKIVAHYVSSLALLTNNKCHTVEIIEEPFWILDTVDKKPQNNIMTNRISYSIKQNKYFSQMDEKELEIEDNLFKEKILIFLKTHFK